MSVWNTLSAGLHIVQEKLDHVLEGDQPDAGDEVSSKWVSLNNHMLNEHSGNISQQYPVRIIW